MKAYKKNILLLGLAMLSGGTIAPSQEWKSESEMKFPKEAVGKVGVRVKQSKAEISNEMMIAHGSLFTDPDHWIGALNDLYRYVEENAKGNSKLMTTAFLVRQEGIGLPLHTQLDFSKNPRKLVSYLSIAKTNLQEKAKILENTTFWVDKKKKNDAKDVLLAVIFLLENTINRVMSNLSR